MKKKKGQGSDLRKSHTTLSREKVQAFIEQCSVPPKKKELLKAFRVRGEYPRRVLREILSELQEEGLYKKPTREFREKKDPAPKKPMDVLEVGQELVGCVYHTNVGLRFIPSQRKINIDFQIENIAEFDTKDVAAAFRATITSENPFTVKMGNRVGSVNDVSLLTAHIANLPMEFSKEAVEQANKGKVPELGDRQDLRPIPLITIDGKDSRDFDDAVWAEPDPDPKNPGGWHIIVAIADVAHYVRPGSVLDKEAYERGTSTYFPDRVIPMLPEVLSNGLCSLNPQEDRACLAVHVWIDYKGKKKRHKFCRALMRSEARMTYGQVQKIYESEDHPDKNLIMPLYGAFQALLKARIKRGTLEINVPEPFVVFDDQGFVKELVPRVRLDSHRLIEEMMILANVAAAETLGKDQLPCMFRVHDKPDRERVEELNRLLQKLKVGREGALKTPRDFTNLLNHVKDTPHQNIVNELVLRSQSQAQYRPQNIGHFGLHLDHYAHFTSPIRRYADILVHRGILKSLGYKEDALPDNAGEHFEDYGLAISTAERRAQGAERDAMDRYMAHYLAGREGETFEVYVTGVSKAGLFVAIPELNTSGLVPLKTLVDDYYVYMEKPTRLEGRRTRRTFGFGDPMTVRLMDVDANKGRLTFEAHGDTFQRPGRSKKNIRRRKKR